MSGENRQLFLPFTSKDAGSHIVRLPNLLEQTPITARPRSECCLKTERISYGLPGLNKEDTTFVKRPKTAGKRPNTSLGLNTNSKVSPEKHAVITPAELSIYKLSKYKNLIKPEIKITETAVGSKEFSKSGIINKRLLDEHIARENDGFDKHESKRTELLKWLQNSGQE
jgi:hypothetical protein